MATKKLVLPLYALNPQKGDPLDVTSEKAHHFAVGSVLGDGSINKRDLNLEISSKSLTYALWKRDVAKSLSLISVRAQPVTKWRLKLANCEVKLPVTVKEHGLKVTSKTNKKFYRSFTWNTRAVFYDKRWRESFYTLSPNPTKSKEFRKSLPNNIKDLFWSDFALAIWYLDDGTYNPSQKAVVIAASEWTGAECKLMQECLKENFNLNFRVYYSKGIPHQFFLEPSDYPAFYKLVKPTIDDLLKAYPAAECSTGLTKKLRLPKVN